MAREHNGKETKIMVDVASLKFDVIFKKAFGQIDVFRQFAQDVLGLSIEIDRVIQSYRYPERAGFVNIEYDLFAEDLKNRVIVEIQHVKRVDFFDRFLYYHLIGLVEQIKTHSDYRFPKAVYTVVVVRGEEPFREVHIPPFSIAVSDMEAYNEFDQPLGIYPHRLVFLNPRAKTDRTPENIKDWLALIEDSLDEQIDETLYPLPIFQKMIEEIRKNNVTPDELTQIKDDASWEGTFEGWREAGHEEGFEEGREAGREEGRIEERRELALSMRQQGMDATLIAQITGLDIEEIQSLENGNSER
jgi:predicted transposase/invertase (TIGR01784 family)